MDDTLKITDRDAIASEIYTHFPDIKKEIDRRWNDKDLRKKVDGFFGPHMLDAIAAKPRAVLSRSIGTPNTELSYFLDLAKELDLEPLILEYPDKFVAKNHDKYHLCRLFFSRILKNGMSIPVATIKIIDFNTEEGKHLGEIKTMWGEDIVAFHHHLLHMCFPGIQDKVIDFSEWFNKTRHITDHYYLYFLSLFICNGVLFDNFLIGDKEEASFIDKKFLPSFREVEKVFGLKPLIYPLLPFENEQFTHWLSYPEALKKMLDERMGVKEDSKKK